MYIYKELDIDLNIKELICFVGAGGKTTTMLQLAEELRTLGKRVLVTTTTAIFCTEGPHYDEIFINDNTKLSTLKDKVYDSSITVIAKEENPKGKLQGIDKEIICDIFTKDIFDYILVEGDGAKRKPIKAPAYYEPVLPKLCSKLVGIVGLDALHKKIDSIYVHRPEIFCKIVNSKMGDMITEDIVHRLIINENGLFKNDGIACKKYLILNKADNKGRKIAGFIIKDMIVRSSFDIEKIIISSIRYKEFYNKINANITGIILASGYSRRMEKQKLVLEIKGIPIIERVIKAVKASEINDIVLIYRDDKIRDLASRYNIRTFYNSNANKGQSEAIKLGVNKSSKETEAYMFFVGDQPYLQTSVINKIIDVFKNKNKKVIVPKYNNKKGNPVLFSSELREELLRLNGDIGGRSIINDVEDEGIVYIHFKDEIAGIDIDTLEDYESYKT